MSAAGGVTKANATRLALLAAGLALWFSPVPPGLTAPAWHLFAVFVTAIASVVLGALPLLTAAVLAAGAAVLTGTVSPAKAYAGFAKSNVLLVVVAFLVARSVVKCGLGQRLSCLVVSAFGRSTLGLGYSIFLTDALIAPAFPSNTARSGVLFPVVLSVAQASGSRPEDGTARKMGSYLMFCGMASIGLSSALWLTATTANPIGVEVAEAFGVKVTFGSWFAAASVPVLVAMGLLPLILYKVFPPEVTATPQAPRMARQALRDMGPLSRDEKVVAAIFAALVTAWALSGPLQINATAVAFAGLGLMLASGVLTLGDISKEGGALDTFLWLGVLFSLSGQLDELGFMGYWGERLAGRMAGLSWPLAYVALVVLYVALHYLFVNQSSHLLALMGIFLDVGVRQGVPPALMAFALLFASSYFSCLTPQGSGSNVIFVGPGYLTQGELYRLGGLAVAFNTLVFLAVGTPWLMWVT